MKLVVRKALFQDAVSIANIFINSHATLAFLPELYSRQQKDWFIKNSVMMENEVFIVETAHKVISFIAMAGTEIKHLYTDPDYQNIGAASSLIKHFQQTNADLTLWCFQENWPARRFYENLGFKSVEFTDGSRNEEKLPDMRYEWVQ